MDPRIKKIEDLSLNAWPSHQIEIYDGWLLRFSYFYTHRTNCVEQLGFSTIPVNEKIRYVEDAYRRWGTPSIFKISPLISLSFDQLLEKRGYQIEHRNYNMLLNIPGAPASVGPAGNTWGNGEKSPSDSPAFPKVSWTNTENLFSEPGQENVRFEVSHFIPTGWIDALFSLKGTTNVMHRKVVPSMYQAIPKETICIAVRDESKKIIGTGLGILDRDYIGVYAIHVHPDYRRHHLARRIVRTIIEEGRRRGARKAYLQVVADNQPAIRLYESLGFRKLYTDYFRVLRNI
jgi:GNAT superfamily N-acetyltransferase